MPLINCLRGKKPIIIHSRNLCTWLQCQGLTPLPRVIVVTRPKENFPLKDHPVIQKALDLLTGNGATIVFKSNIHQKFPVMDQKIVWYGSINLLSYGSSQESIMRIEGSNISNELMKSIEGL